MRHLTMVVCCMCKRFKSSSSKDNGEVLRRFHAENLLSFGKLLKSSTVRRKKQEKPRSNAEKTKVHPAGCVEEKVLPQSGAGKIVSNDILQQDEKSPKRSIQSNSSPNKSTDMPIERVDKIRDSLISFPFLNLKKEKYTMSSSSETTRIGKLSNYHPDYKTISEILSNSMSSQSAANLQRWKTSMISKLGQEEFETFNKNQMSLGSTFRTYVLKYLSGVPEDDLKIGDELKNYWSSAKAVFDVFHNIVDVGALVAHPDLKYKGSLDCLAVFRDEVMLVSWKKSDKYVPSLERTFDIPLQIAAYMGALNFDERYPFRVEQALLVMAYNDGSKADLFHLNEEKCLFYWKQWLERLNTYLVRAEESKNERNDTSSKILSEKIDIDNELQNMAVRNQFSGRIVKEEEEEKIRVENISEIHPLSNSQKLNYNPKKEYSIEPSVEYQNNGYPSVSSILSDTKSEASKYILERWRRSMIEKLGQEGFENYERETLESGSTLHEYVRMRFSGELDDGVKIPKNIEGFWQSLSSVFPNIGDVVATESRVAHPGCKYRGIVDCIGFYQDKLVLIDWKTSEKTKASISMTYDAPIQIAAYIGAVNFDPSYPFKVEDGLIVVAYNDGTKANVFYLNKEKCLNYWKKWLNRLNKYQTIAYENGTKILY